MYVNTVDPNGIENNTFNGIHVKAVDTCIYSILAVRTVAAGHRMVAEGWTLFEKTCEEVGPGELPQLLRKLKAATTESASPQVKSEPVKEGEEEVKEEIIKTPIMIKLGVHQ